MYVLRLWKIVSESASSLINLLSDCHLSLIFSAHARHSLSYHISYHRLSLSYEIQARTKWYCRLATGYNWQVIVVSTINTYIYNTRGCWCFQMRDRARYHPYGSAAELLRVKVTVLSVLIPLIRVGLYVTYQQSDENVKILTYNKYIKSIDCHDKNSCSYWVIKDNTMGG